jgi:hypothetical protein
MKNSNKSFLKNCYCKGYSQFFLFLLSTIILLFVFSSYSYSQEYKWKKVKVGGLNSKGVKGSIILMSDTMIIVNYEYTYSQMQLPSMNYPVKVIEDNEQMRKYKPRVFTAQMDSLQYDQTYYFDKKKRIFLIKHRNKITKTDFDTEFKLD